MGEKGQNGTFFGVLSFMKIPLVSPSLNEKEQKCFGHPKFYCSIAPMRHIDRNGHKAWQKNTTEMTNK